MFVDKAKIYIKAGDGGDGRVSFRREKYVPSGGPNGGNGGKGGDVIFIADPNMRTLMDFRYKRKYIAGNGEIGGINNCFGKDGNDLYIRVPIGTIIRDATMEYIYGDLNKGDQRLIVVKGGKGGKGNAQFATSTRQAPRFAKLGEKGEETSIVLELKLIADVGLVGLPNVGKSTLLSIATAAKPKIADYHFTTLSPNLGVVELGEGRSFVMADIPGLIEGAHEGAGLGHDFLRHIERTKVIIHVLDVSGIEGRDPIDDFNKINKELSFYSEKLGTKTQVVACNKMDITGSDENYQRVKETLLYKGYNVYPISGATKFGIKPLLDKVYNILKEYEEDEDFIEIQKTEPPFRDRDRDNKGYTIKISEGAFIIEGEWVDRLLASVNVHDNEGLKYFQKVIRRKGINEELDQLGIKDGDTVRMQDFEFEHFD